MNLSIPSLPSSGASPTGFGEGFSPDLCTGTGNYSIPIELPKFQRGFLPELTLNYSSGAGQGAFGQGWSLVGLISVRVSTRHGVPDPAEYLNRVYTIGGGEDLVLVSGNSSTKTYRCRTETNKWKISQRDEGWMIETLDGTVYECGTTIDSRITNPNTGENVEWLVSRMVLSTGQEMNFSYSEAGPARLIESISYGPYSAQFIYEKRPDIFTNAKYGFLLSTEFRCSEIRVLSNRATDRYLKSYLLDYKQDPVTFTSLFVGLSVSGGTAESGLESFPQLRFEYTEWCSTEVVVTRLASAGELPPVSSTPGTVVLDLEGRGLPGILQGASTGWRYWRNLGNGSYASPLPMPDIPLGVSLEDGEGVIIDLEGNGTSDILIDYPRASGYYPNLADGTFGELMEYASRPPVSPKDSKVRFVDIDGNGVVDAIKSDTNALLLYKNNGSDGWSHTPLIVPRQYDLELFPNVDFDDESIFFADMSGDGLPDIVKVSELGTQYWPYLGYGRWDKRITLENTPAFLAQYDPKRLRLVDVNGDGVADLVYLESAKIHICRNRQGKSWADSIEIDLPAFHVEDIDLVDVMGFGQPALLLGGPDPDGGINKVLHSLVFSGKTISNLLSRIRSDLGHVTSITYGVSTEDMVESEYEENNWESFSPFPVPVCRAVENNDLVTGIRSTVSYRYRNGHYCGTEREFRGFAEVEEIEESSGTSVCKRTVSQFHLGTNLSFNQFDRTRLNREAHSRLRALRGSPISVEVFEEEKGKSPTKLKHIKNTFETRVEILNDSELVVRPFLACTTEDSFDSDGNAVREKLEYSAPNLDGYTELIIHMTGQLSLDGRYTADRKTTERLSYAKGISGLTTVVKLNGRVVIGDSGGIISAQRWFFDGADFKGLDYGNCEKGLVTRYEELVYADGQDDPGNKPAERGFFRVEHSDFPSGWYRCPERKSYDSSGNISGIQNPLGGYLSINYDKDGVYPISVTDAAGRVTTIDYNHDVELPSRVRYPSGIVETRDYDHLGRVVAAYRTHSDGLEHLVSATTYEIAAFEVGGKVITPPTITTYVSRQENMCSSELKSGLFQKTDNAYILRRFYSANGLEISAVSSAAPGSDGSTKTKRSADCFFQGNGFLVSESLPSFDENYDWKPPVNSSQRAYTLLVDALGRSKGLNTPAGSKQIIFGVNHTRVKDPNSVAANLTESIVQSQNSSGWITGTEEALNDDASSSKSYAYDDAQNLTAILDSDGSDIVNYSYCRIGKRTKVLHRDLGERKFEHDAAGRVVSATTASGQLIEYQYDTIGRLIKVLAIDSQGLHIGSKKFVYQSIKSGPNDSGSFLSSVEEDGVVTTFKYDAAGRLIEKTRAISAEMELIFRYEYDFLGNMRRIIYPNGFTVDYEFGPGGEITKVSGYIENASYNARGMLEKVCYSNNVNTTLEYNEAERLHRVETSFADQSHFEQFLEYDSNGNILDVKELEDDLSQAFSYRYDRANRLIRVSEGGNSRSLNIEYDRESHIVKNDEHGLRTLQYHSQRPSLLLGPNGSLLRRYDAGGRTITTEKLQSLDYDSFDRLRRVVRDSNYAAEFEYDYLGSRTKKTIYEGDDVRAIHYMDDLYEVSSSGERMIIRGPLGIVAIVDKKGQDEKIRYCHSDYLGSVRCQTSTTGVVKARARYSSFGMTDPGSDFAIFAGKFGDDDIGLIQLGQRFYEPRVGRFITPDEMLVERPELAGLIPSYLNLYSYAANNPIRYVDPTGRLPFLAVVLIGAAIGAMAAAEQGEDPLKGAIFGALVGGVVGWAALAKPALIGAGIGALTSSKDRMWSGAAVGFVFGAVGGAVGKWLPVVPGDSTGSMVSNFFIEVTADGLVTGLAAGTKASMKGENFGEAFESGFVSGALASTAQIAVFGVGFDATSANKSVANDTEQAYKIQNAKDKNGPWSASTRKMPDISSVNVRRGGLLTATGRSHAIAPNTVTLSNDAVNDLGKGDYSTLAHELRHISQQRAADWGWLEYAVVWLRSDGKLHYQPGNNTLEPPY